MKTEIKKAIHKAKFQPGILGFFINHNFLIRSGLDSALKTHSSKLTGVLLDFGCGSKPYKQYFKNSDQYIGIDIKIEGRSENHAHIDKFYDGHTIPFEDGYFDSLLRTEVLEHVFNIDRVLSEMHRTLRIALITTPFMWEEHEMPHDFARYTPPALKHLYTKHGFEVIEHHKSGNYITVLFQFLLNYIKNILPENKVLRQILLLPFIATINLLGTIFGFILPRSQAAYFNNIFILRKT